MLEQFEKIGKDALAELKEVKDAASLENFRLKYLSRKGLVTQMLSQVGQFPSEQRPAAGQIANQVKKEVHAEFENVKNTHCSVAGRQNRGIN